ncbi:5-formyltetrahydrofolate cyclo-ligase [Bacillaceae bacterium S4-13-56]
MQSKKELRNEMINYLKEIPKNEREARSQNIHRLITNHSFWKNNHWIGLTISQEHEVDTYSLIQSGWEDGKRICVPKCDPKQKKLTFYEITSFDQLEVVFYGLHEPIPMETRVVTKSQLEGIIVPGLLFDKKGFRIGYGGGYFDRYLVDFQGETISVFFEEQLFNGDLPHEEHDVPIQSNISNKGVIK